MIGLAFIGVGLGAGLAVLGAGLGIGRIGDSAAAAISRQPEAVGSIQLAMIISAALIEGAALFGLDCVPHGEQHQQRHAERFQHV